MIVTFAIPTRLRRPLLLCASACLLAPGMLAWSIASSASTEDQLVSLRDQLAQSRSRLTEHHQNALALAQALRLLDDVRPLSEPEAGGETSRSQTATELWQEHQITLELLVAHEEILLAQLAEWQSRSPVQHHIRACRIHRHDEGLLAECRLSALALIRKPPQ